MRRRLSAAIASQNIDDGSKARVNLASKLGEDLAGPGEILVTREAYARIPAEAGIQFKEVNFTISGIELNACSIDWK